MLGDRTILKAKRFSINLAIEKHLPMVHNSYVFTQTQPTYELETLEDGCHDYTRKSLYVLW